MKDKERFENLPSIANKLYFSIVEASALSLVEPHVLRYWEKEFAPILSPSKRKGGRRYYERADILVIRRIRELLYKHGFTIEGAKVKIKSELDGKNDNDNNNEEDGNKKDKGGIPCYHGSNVVKKAIEELRKVIDILGP